MKKLLLPLLLAPLLAHAGAPQCLPIVKEQSAIIKHERDLGSITHIFDRQKIWWAGMTIAMCESKYWAPVQADSCSKFWRSQLRGHMYVAFITGLADATAINEAQFQIDACKRKVKLS